MFGSDWPVCKVSQPQCDYRNTVNLLLALTDHLTAEDVNKTLQFFYSPTYKFDPEEKKQNSPCYRSSTT